MRHKIALPFILCIVAAIVLATDQLLPKAEQRSPTQSTRPRPPKVTSHVILISVSGLRADDINDAEKIRLDIPTILALRKNGTYAVGVESVYPSQTVPAHVSIITGVLPADHGITSDFPFNPQTGTQSTTPHFSSKEIKAETIWEAARREGLVTASVCYPMTADANINFNLPELSPTDVNSKSNPPGLINEVRAVLQIKQEIAKGLSSADKLSIQTQDSLKADAAAYLYKRYRPNLLLVNFTSLETVQKQTGLRSIETRTVMKLVDSLIGKLISAAKSDQALDEEATVLLVSDHGLSQTEREFRPNVLLAKSGLLNSDEQGNVKSWRAIVQSFEGSAALFLKNPKDDIAIKEVEKIISELNKESENPLWRVTSQREGRRLGIDPNAFLFIDAAPKYKISSRINGSVMAKTEGRAVAGYLPSRAEMLTPLIISGKGIKVGQKIEYAKLTDIAPTICRLLGLEIKLFRGRSLNEVIIQ